VLVFILQSLLLIAAAFIIGAILGSVFRRLSPGKPSAADSSTQASNARLASADRLLAVNDDVKKSAAAAAAMVPPAEPVPPRPVSPSRKPAPRKAEPEAAARHPRQNDSNRPGLLKKARRGKPDKLSEIDGIGSVIESKLFSLGIFHYDQIAAWTIEQAEWVSIEIGFAGRAVRENWVRQAGALAKPAKPKAARKPAK
jgi:predicted flap endonuclease-1-like 5' DNA nuclease